MFNINRLEDALGAEITGITLGDFDDTGIETLKAALFEHNVVCIRNQHDFTPDQHIALTKRLGEIHEYVLNNYCLPNHPEILVLSNEIDEQGRAIGVKDGAQYWHTDTSYEERPLWFSILRAIKLPEKDGTTLGNTLFASTAASYDALSDDMKNKLEGLKNVHSYNTYTKVRPGREKVRGKLTQKQIDNTPDRIQPVIRTHRANGRKCLFVNEGYSIKICDLPEGESEDLLEELFKHINNPKFTYRHHWQPGDVLIWDNPQTQHCLIGDYDVPLTRTMYRTATRGPIPI